MLPFASVNTEANGVASRGGVGLRLPRVNEQMTRDVLRHRHSGQHARVSLDHSIQVGIDEVQAWRGPPMPQEPRLDVFLGQRLLEKQLVIEMDLADRQLS